MTGMGPGRVKTKGPGENKRDRPKIKAILKNGFPPGKP